MPVATRIRPVTLDPVLRLYRLWHNCVIICLCARVPGFMPVSNVCMHVCMRHRTYLYGGRTDIYI